MPQEIYRIDVSPRSEQIIDYGGLAKRKAEEAAARRYQAAQWLRQMDQSAAEVLPEEPTEGEFHRALHNGLILCNVLNKVNPGAIQRVVERRASDAHGSEAASYYSAIQSFENTRNFVVSIARLKLLAFEVSDLEKGGSMNKVVDCILCLRGYYEWKQSGGTGVWKYGGTVKIIGLAKDPPSSVVSCESTDESLDDSETSQYEQLIEFLHMYNDSCEESKTANVVTFMFDHYSLGLLQAYLMDTNGFGDDLPLSSTVVDIVVRKVVKDFSAMLVSQGNQLGTFLKRVLNTDCTSNTKSQFLEVVSRYLTKRTSFVSRDISNFCVCNGDEAIGHKTIPSCANAERLNLLQKPLDDLKALFRETKQEVYGIQTGLENELLWLGHHVKDLEVAAASYHNVLEENRMLYNQVQELKGTIRVYCRVRPSIPGQSSGQSTVDYIGDNGSIMIANPHKQGKDARRVFSLNKVFGTNATQRQIYSDIQPLVRSVLDGYNVCIFAYGQTGSGKTYTMSGPDITAEETWGVNYRALRDLFHISKSRTDIVRYEIFVQMIEIYNEQVRDLLAIDGSNQRLDIRNNSQLNGLNVPDASLIPVNCTQDVLDLMRIGHRNRTIGATALNVRSSRSHSILTIHVRGKEVGSSATLKGCLHLVDLAGSERVDKSEAIGETLKEAQHINKSLSALGDVIAALAQKTSHVPYRNSKLTQVLQDSLGGHAKTLMLVHIDPDVNALGETISTLKFAERVSSIELGESRSNKETSELRECKDEISNLKSILERKEAELEQLKSRTSSRGAGSPLRMSKHNSATSHDTQTTEVRSSSVGKQGRFQSPAKLQKPEERSVGSSKPRFTSPPVRRSSSSERGSVIKTRTKSGAPENQPVKKALFPSSVAANKSINLSTTTPSTVTTRIHQDSQQIPPFSDVFHSMQKVEEESKFMIKHKSSAKTRDFSDSESEMNLQSVEQREVMRTLDPFSSGQQLNKESISKTTVPKLMRSRSNPRGKFMTGP